jgi:hypothetical protein
MSIDIGRMISDIQSAMNSPQAIWDRKALAAERETALNNEDYRKRKLLEMSENAATARTGLTVAGNADVQKIANTGALARTQLTEGGLNARQRLTQDFQGGQFERTQGLAEKVAGQNYELGGRKVDQELTSANQSGLKAKLDALGIVAKDISDPQAQKEAKADISSLINPNRFAKFDKPDAATPAASVTPELQKPTAITSIRQPETERKSLTGAQSMEFAAPATLEQRTLLKRNKKVEEEMFGKKDRSAWF